MVLTVTEEKNLIIWSSFWLPNQPPFPYHTGAERDVVSVESVDVIPECPGTFDVSFTYIRHFFQLFYYFQVHWFDIESRVKITESVSLLLKVSHVSHLLKSHVRLFVLLLQTITLSIVDATSLQLVTGANVTVEFYDFEVLTCETQHLLSSSQAVSCSPTLPSASLFRKTLLPRMCLWMLDIP